MIKLIKNIKKKKILKIKRYSQFYEAPFGKKILEKELMILKRELNGCNIILSVGCGTAIHEIKLAESNPDLEIICIDPSQKMLGESQNLSKEIKCCATSKLRYLVGLPSSKTINNLLKMSGTLS